MPNEVCVYSGTPPRIVKITAPTEFKIDQSDMITVRLTPSPPETQHASSTPINIDLRETIKSGLANTVAALTKNLGQYQNETTSDRATSAGQLRTALFNLENILLQKDKPNGLFHETDFQNTLEAISFGFAEDIAAFEGVDKGYFQQIVIRGRQLYAYYPALAEINDPNNTNLIGSNFPYSGDELEKIIGDLLNSDDGQEIFTDETREFFERERRAITPQSTDAEKYRQARFGAIIGEMLRRLNTKGQNTAGWISVAETVKKIWDAISPFLGL